MHRKRGELVPIGEVFGGLGGPVKAIREASPQALHHFTRFDQVEPTCQRQRSGCLPGLHGAADGAVLAAPHQPRQPERIQARQRTFHALHGRRWRQQAPLRQLAPLDPGLGLDQAVRTQSRELVLGKSLSEFMRTLGIYNRRQPPNPPSQSDAAVVRLHRFDDLRGQVGVYAGQFVGSGTRSSTIRCRST